MDSSIDAEMFASRYADVFAGDEAWQSLPTPVGDTFAWAGDSTYVRKPPYFDGMGAQPDPVTDIVGARVLAKLGDSVTTDHISPAGSIKPDSPAGKYLAENGVDRKDFNSYGSRRGNHEVMIRGTFANIRLRNQLLDGVEGGFTRDFTLDGAPAVGDLRRRAVLRGCGHPAGGARGQGVRLGLVARLGGQGHGAAGRHGGDRGVLRAHPPLEPDRHGRPAAAVPRRGRTPRRWAWTARRSFSISGVTALNEGVTPRTVSVRAESADGSAVEFDAVLRIDTPGEADYYRNGGILQYVLRSLV